MASMKSRLRPSHDAKLHMLAEPLDLVYNEISITASFSRFDFAVRIYDAKQARGEYSRFGFQ